MLIVRHLLTIICLHKEATVLVDYRYTLFVFTWALKLFSGSHSNSKRPLICHYIMAIITLHNRVQLCNCRAFLLMWMKWRHWVQQSLQELLSVIEGRNPLAKEIFFHRKAPYEPNKVNYYECGGIPQEWSEEKQGPFKYCWKST